MSLTRRTFLQTTAAAAATAALGRGLLAAPAKKRPLRILVLGGTGFLGPATIEVATNSADYAMLAKLVAAKAIKLKERTSWGDRFVPDGVDVVRMKVDLIERKTIIHQAMKAQKKSVVDDNLTSGQSLEASLYREAGP